MINNYKIVATEDNYNAGNNWVRTYTVWLPEENLTLFVNASADEITVTTVNHFGCDITIDDYEAITVLCASNNDFLSDSVQSNKYALIAIKCYAQYMQEVKNAMVITERDACYSEEVDITFIMEHLLVNNETWLTEVTGWYYGEPDDKIIERYSDRKMFAFYDH